MKQENVATALPTLGRQKENIYKIETGKIVPIIQSTNYELRCTHDMEKL